MPVIELFLNGAPLDRSYSVVAPNDKFELRFYASERSRFDVFSTRFGLRTLIAVEPRAISLLEAELPIELPKRWIWTVAIEIVRRGAEGAKAPASRRVWLLSRPSVAMATAIACVGALALAWWVAHLHQHMHPGVLSTVYKLAVGIMGIIQAGTVARALFSSDKDLPVFGVVHLWERALVSSAAAVSLSLLVPMFFFTVVHNETPHAIVIKTSDEEIKIAPGDIEILPTRMPRSASFYYQRLSPAEMAKRASPSVEAEGQSYAPEYLRADAHRNYCLHGISDSGSKETANLVETSEGASTGSRLSPGCESYPMGNNDASGTFRFIPRVAIRCRGVPWPLAGFIASPRRGVTSHAGMLWLRVNPDDCSNDPGDAEISIRLMPEEPSKGPAGPSDNGADTMPESGRGAQLRARLGLDATTTDASMIVKYPWNGESLPQPDGAAQSESTRFEIMTQASSGVRSIKFSSTAIALPLGGADRSFVNVAVGTDRGGSAVQTRGNLACARIDPGQFTVVQMRAGDGVHRVRLTSNGCAGSWSDWQGAAPPATADAAWGCDLRDACGRAAEAAPATSPVRPALATKTVRGVTPASSPMATDGDAPGPARATLNATITVRRDQEPDGVALSIPASLALKSIDIQVEVDGHLYTVGRLECPSKGTAMSIRPIRVFVRETLEGEADRLDLDFSVDAAVRTASGAESRGPRSEAKGHSVWVRDPTWSALESRVPGWKSPWVCEPDGPTRARVQSLSIKGREVAATLGGGVLHVSPAKARQGYFEGQSDQLVRRRDLARCANRQHCCLDPEADIRGYDEVWRCDCDAQKPPRCD